MRGALSLKTLNIEVVGSQDILALPCIPQICHIGTPSAGCLALWPILLYSVCKEPVSSFNSILNYSRTSEHTGIEKVDYRSVTQDSQPQPLDYSSMTQDCQPQPLCVSSVSWAQLSSTLLVSRSSAEQPWVLPTLKIHSHLCQCVKSLTRDRLRSRFVFKQKAVRKKKNSGSGIKSKQMSAEIIVGFRWYPTEKKPSFSEQIAGV